VNRDLTVRHPDRGIPLELQQIHHTVNARAWHAGKYVSSALAQQKISTAKGVLPSLGLCRRSRTRGRGGHRTGLVCPRPPPSPSGCMHAYTAWLRSNPAKQNLPCGPCWEPRACFDLTVPSDPEQGVQRRGLTRPLSPDGACLVPRGAPTSQPVVFSSWPRSNDQVAAGQPNVSRLGGCFSGS